MYLMGLILCGESCGLSTCVFALDEPDSIGPRVSGYLDVAVVFLNRFLGTYRQSARLPYLSVARPSHPWRSV